MRTLSLFFFTMILSLTACSNDDDSNRIKPTYSNIDGTWIISKIIQPDGTVKNYVGECAAKSDSVNFNRYGRKTLTYIHSDCDTKFSSSLEGCSGFEISPEDTLRICSDLFQGKITMTKTTLRLDYKEVETFSLPKLNNIKGVIFVRK
jgi:hypothetical protein